MYTQKKGGLTDNDQFHGTRPVVGHSPYKPWRLAGMRIEPPISVPIPSMLPPEATKAASPPEDPPEIRLTLRAFTLCPKTWLYESDIYWVLFCFQSHG